MTTEKPIPAEPEHVTCGVCLKEIPKSVAQTHEGADYIHHFCGLECFDAWRKQQAPADTSKA